MRVLTTAATTTQALPVEARQCFVTPKAGRTSVIPVAGYLGFTGYVKAQTATYFTVRVVNAQGQQRTATVWFSAAVEGSKRWTADYQKADMADAVEISQAHDVRAALASALWHAADRLAHQR